MKRPPATLRDVAAEAGVHTSTVSRALNPATRGIVNAATAERVIDAARRLGYAPHPLARGLRTNTTMTVGMVIPDVENPLFGPIIAGVEEELGDSGYSLLIANTQPDREEEQGAIDALLGRRVDGLIIATATHRDEVTRKLVERGVAAVMVNRHDSAATFPSIIGDDARGIQLAVDHLRTLGHESIAHISGPEHLSTGAARAAAFVAAMGGKRSDCLIEQAEWFGIDPGARALDRLLDRCSDVTAVVAANDLIALGCYRAARRRDVAIGAGLSVTGYNDMALADLMQPALTSVRIPYRSMGAAAARTLLQCMKEDGAADPDRVLLEPTLIVRESTAPLQR